MGVIKEKSISIRADVHGLFNSLFPHDSGEDDPAEGSGEGNPTEGSGEDDPTEGSGEDNPIEGSGDGHDGDLVGMLEGHSDASGESQRTLLTMHLYHSQTRRRQNQLDCQRALKENERKGKEILPRARAVDDGAAAVLT